MMWLLWVLGLGLWEWLEPWGQRKGQGCRQGRMRISNCPGSSRHSSQYSKRFSNRFHSQDNRYRGVCLHLNPGSLWRQEQVSLGRSRQVRKMARGQGSN
ncbi:hypothetical protein DUD43_17500 [Alcaligenes faecalis]|nr:hypothetical protein DUD43_17500 [Alcaligenes faecalis]